MPAISRRYRAPRYLWDFVWQYDAFVTQPDMHLTHTLELGEFREDELQCFLDPLIRVLLIRTRPVFT